MTPTAIFKDHTGQWREKNPFPEFNEYCIAQDIEYSKNPEWKKFEQSIQYHEFPNEPDVKPGEVVMARLQWQWQSGLQGKWQNCMGNESEYGKLKIPTRQIWVAVTDSAKDEEAKDFGNDNHLYNCPFCNGSEKDHIVLLGYKYPKYRVSCSACGYFIEDDRKDKVLELWNTRNGKGWLESSLSRSVPKVEVSAEDKLFEVSTGQNSLLYDVIHIPEEYAIKAMEQYATLKASSLQSLLEDKQRSNDYLVQRIDEAEVKLMNKEKEVAELLELLMQIKDNVLVNYKKNNTYYNLVYNTLNKKA